MHILYWISLGFVLAGLGLLIYIIIKDAKPLKQQLEKKKKHNYAILIPARNESAVIENLLKSIAEQTDLKNTYVIVEKASDKSCRIAEKYGANVFVRNVTKETKRKGYALDECLKYILSKKKKYDLYFIFDADNVIAPNYFDEMLKTYSEGYLIGTGYRNIKNNDNVYATCSGLTFSAINFAFNERRNYTNKGIIIMGTGYYIDSSLIEKWNGFPFHSLAEDYELSLYCSEHNISTHYNEKAEFFDEQPTTMKTSITQRTRWVKGFLEARKKIKKINNKNTSRLFGILPYLLIIIGFALYLFSSFMISFYYIIRGNLLFRKYLIYILITLLIVYMILFAITYLIIIKEVERLNIPASNTLKALFINPIFLLTYIICLFKALRNPNLEWEQIEHNKTMS